MLTILFSLIVLSFLGPLSGLQDSGSFICQLSDAPTQCGAFCLAALRPLFDDKYISQNKLNRIEEGVESLKKTNSREERQLVATNSEIKNALQVLQAEIKNLETKNAALLQRFERKMEAQLKDLQNKSKSNKRLTLNQQSTTQKTPSETYSTTRNQKIIPPKFELIGTRYFYIEQNILKPWNEAAETCRGMGGYLAAFKTQEELAAIMPKLYSYYWTGIKKEDGQFISTASGKPATALKWYYGKPNNNGACVLLNNMGMFDVKDCSNKWYFICQSDNET